MAKLNSTFYLEVVRVPITSIPDLIDACRATFITTSFTDEEHLWTFQGIQGDGNPWVVKLYTQQDGSQINSDFTVEYSGENPPCEESVKKIFALIRPLIKARLEAGVSVRTGLYEEGVQAVYPLDRIKMIRSSDFCWIIRGIKGFNTVLGEYPRYVQDLSSMVLGEAVK